MGDHGNVESKFKFRATLIAFIELDKSILYLGQVESSKSNLVKLPFSVYITLQLSGFPPRRSLKRRSSPSSRTSLNTYSFIFGEATAGTYNLHKNLHQLVSVPPPRLVCLIFPEDRPPERSCNCPLNVCLS